MFTLHNQRWSRYLLVFLMAVILALLPFGTVACSVTDTSSEQNSSSVDDTSDGLVIVASIFAPYDFSRVITGGTAQVSMLVPPGVETHSFEPSPTDIMMLNSADVFIYVGGESDAWLEKIIESLDNPDLVLVRLTDLVDTLEEEELEGVTESDEEHESDEDEGHDIDEHVWTSLRNAQLIVDSLAETFSELDSENAELFLDNAENYNNELSSLDDRITAMVQSAERTTIVFGDRFPFRYFAEDYGLTIYAAFSGCSTAVDTNPETLVFLIETVQTHKIPVVFHIELSDQRIAHTIAEGTGATVLLLHSAHNISQEDLDAGVSYLDLMKKNADNLEVALN